MGSLLTFVQGKREPGGLRATTFWNSATVERRLPRDKQHAVSRVSTRLASCFLLLSVAPSLHHGPSKLPKSEDVSKRFKSELKRHFCVEKALFNPSMGFSLGPCSSAGPIHTHIQLNTHLQLAGHTHTHTHTHHHIQ